jgi:integrase
MRKTLTDKGVAALKPRPKGYAFPDPELRGHYVRVRPSGVKTFTCVVRDPRGKQIWTTIGAADGLTISEARTKARKAIERVREGLPALEEPQTKSGFEAVAEEWLKRHVRAKGLRSEGEVTRLLRAHVFPRWKGRNIIEIRRSHVAALLDHVEDNHGARQADYVLAIVRGIMNWYATRHDDYVPPVAKGMRRTNPKERARSRVLTDDEIRAIWSAADGTFGAVVKMLLLTGQRREKILSMRWQDVSLDGEWTIPSEAREKGNAGALMLPEAALSVVVQQPRLDDNPYVFAGRGDGHINGPSKAKRQLDAKLPEMPQWQLHDCRRTFRSLLSRAGVSSDIAERLMGHALQGVEGVYDRHSYRNEKADALKRLAALISEIVSGEPSGKVVKLRKARADA